mgnify:CR=1 FL=1|tara:strand:+ start:502 stop:1443 length:942 start_codon:yes stop_codon:yes gene_type:complete
MSASIEEDTKNFLGMFKTKINTKTGSYPNKILISGMGGSGISGRIMETVAQYENIGEIFSWNNYGIPKWITPEDNIICISYSGNTAETLSAANKAKELGCKIEVITTGGKLGNLADKHNWNKTIIEEGHQPRAALPLLLKPLLFKLNIPDIDNIVEEVSTQDYNKREIKKLVSKLANKIPCIYTEAIMEPVGYRWRCQIQENAKQLAFHHVIPEMNHNEIVGWTSLNPKIIPVLIRKNNEEEKIRNRFEALKKTAWKNIDIEEIFVNCERNLATIMEGIFIGDMVSIELAKLNNIDPTPVKVIENLKKELGGR